LEKVPTKVHGSATVVRIVSTLYIKVVPMVKVNALTSV
jgi:hypothetical protein